MLLGAMQAPNAKHEPGARGALESLCLKDHMNLKRVYGPYTYSGIITGSGIWS